MILLTKKEIEIIISDDELYDLLMYVYCLRRAPEQFANVPNISSEINQVERNFIEALKVKKNSFL